MVGQNQQPYSRGSRPHPDGQSPLGAAAGLSVAGWMSPAGTDSSFTFPQHTPQRHRCAHVLLRPRRQKVISATCRHASLVLAFVTMEDMLRWGLRESGAWGIPETKEDKPRQRKSRGGQAPCCRGRAKPHIASTRGPRARSGGSTSQALCAKRPDSAFICGF